MTERHHCDDPEMCTFDNGEGCCPPGCCEENEESMTEHNHGTGGDVSYADCPACRENRRTELEADVDFWGGTVTWDDEKQ